MVSNSNLSPEQSDNLALPPGNKKSNDSLE